MATAATASGIRISRPSIYIGGQEDSGLAQALLQMAISESVHGLYHCEARFGNWGPKGNSIGFMYFDRSKLDFGKPMQIKIDQAKIFDGRISALEGNFAEARPPEIAVLLEDRFQDMRMTQRTRTFTDVSDSDVINRIASDYGLQPNIDVSGPTYKVLAQVNQSDLSFLRERARSIDAEIWLDDRNLYCKARGKRNNGTVKVNYSSELREVTVIADLAGQRSSISVNGWDISGKSAMTYEAKEQVVSGELNGDSSGISILKSAFGARKEALAHTVPLSSREAQAEAEAVMRMTARRFVVAHGMAQGDAKLRVGTYIDMQGLGPLFSGKYYLAHVKHVFDATLGFRTEFTAERPGIGKAQ
jgi:Bacteriophage probable baseplate hub protein